MLKNYLKIALRNLHKHKGYSLINILGLAVGMASCILIMLFVRHEWSFDRFHDNADRIHRAWVLEDYSEEQRYFNTVTPHPLGPALAQNYPEVEQATRVAIFGTLVEYGAASFNERVHLVDPNFLEVFDFALLEGDPANLFPQRNTVVLTETAATRYFGRENPIGKTLSIEIDEEAQDFVVSGLAKDVPTHSSIRFDLLLSFEKGDDMWSERYRQSWTNVAPETYVLLREGVSGDALEAKLPTMVQQVMGENYEPGVYTVGLQALTDIHLNTDFPAGIEPTSDPVYSYILFTIAILVLVIACINFMTLSIGHSVGRAREVGVRKVVGAYRNQLMQQFWGETLLLTGLAMVTGVGLAQAFLPLFNDLAGQELVLALDTGTLLFFAGIVGLVALVAGGYPAVVLSGFQPVEVLKGKLNLRRGSGVLQRSLLVVQFALSIMLIVCTLLMSQQLDYLQTRNLGFNKEQVVVIPTGLPPQEGMEVVERMRNELASNPAILGVAASAYTFGAGTWGTIGYTANDGIYREFAMNIVDPDYIQTLGMSMAVGRNFSRDNASDERQALIVNEAFVRAYGWDAPLQERLPGKFDDHEIIGVIEDFNYASMHTEVLPLVLTLNPGIVHSGASDHMSGQSSMPKLAVRVAPGDLPTTVALLEQTWQEVAPGLPFDFSFLDEAVDSQYRQEERLGQMVRIAALLAVLIACLGLLGLAALTVTRRTKEIGVRKVLGASVRDIVWMLSKDFALLVLIAAVLAAPVAYLAIQQWLNGFVYRIAIGPLTFVLATLLVLTVAFLTVSYQSIKAAVANPVDALRSE